MKNGLFQRIKQLNCVETITRMYNFEIKKVGQKQFISCPFHPDTKPSLALDPSGWFCFGCGERGDLIEFVAKMDGLRPIEAARKIALAHGVAVDRPPTKEEREQNSKRKGKSRLQRAFECWEKEVFQRLCKFRDGIQAILERYKLNVEGKMLKIYRKLPYAERLIEALFFGTAEEVVFVVSVLLIEALIELEADRIMDKR